MRIADLNEAVLCTTQEEWDYVFSKYPGKINYGKSILQDKKSICLNLESLYHASLNHYREEGYIIYSFQEWCEKFGHKPNSIKPQLETVSKEQELLEEAKRRYPLGTKVRSAYDSQYEFTIGEEFDVRDTYILCKSKEGAIFYIYYNSKWAEVINTLVKDKPYEYKIGDWCYIIDKKSARLENRKVYQINDIKDPSFHFDDGSGQKENRCWVLRGGFRLAALDEIEQSKKKYKTTNTKTYTFSVNPKFDQAVDKDLHEKSYNGIVASQIKNHLLDKDYSSILNKELQLPKRTVKQTKKLIY
jgi:hypothetical protein